MTDAQAIPRILALDVGDKRIGVAINDPVGGSFAQPLLTVYRTTLRADLKSIARLVRRYGVAEVVVGNPLHISGEVSPQAIKTQRFLEELRGLMGDAAPVFHLVDERLTSHDAHLLLDESGHPRGASRRAIIDQVAAVLLLDSFLQARNTPVLPPLPGTER